MDSTLRARGKEARRRAELLSGSARINTASWYPALQWMDDLGYTREEIAESTTLGIRRVRDIFQWGNTEGSALIHIDKAPVRREALEPKYQAMMEFTPEGFKAFYEEFSEYDELPGHCWDWVQAFIDHRNLMLNLPPRHMKSDIFSHWIPVWLLCMNRDEQIIIVSKTGKLSRLWAATIAFELEFGRIPEVFGRFAPERKGDTPWRPGQGELLVLGRTKAEKSQQFSIFARGQGQAIFGHEATVVIADDPTDARIAKSETQNQDQMEWFMEQVMSRIEVQARGGASGRAVIVGQRVHYHDMYGQIASQVWERGPKIGQPLWTTITGKAVLRWPDEDPDNPEPLVLWPEKWNFDELMLQMARVGGASVFETMFQQNPLPDDAKIVRPEWWDRCKDLDRVWGPAGRADREFSRVISLDPSPSKYNGLVVADVLYDKTRFYAQVLEARHFKGGLRDIVSNLESAISAYQPDYCIVEFSTFTTWLLEDPQYIYLANLCKMIPHSTGRNKGDPELGLESLGYDIESGNVRLPYGDKESRDMSQQFQREFDVWVRDGRNEDDQMMALWFIKWNWKRFIPRNLFKGEGNPRANVPARLAGGFAWAKK